MGVRKRAPKFFFANLHKFLKILRRYADTIHESYHIFRGAKIFIEVIYMDVNLKLPQDVGASGYASPVKQGGFSIRSSPETLKKPVSTAPKLSSVAKPNGTEAEEEQTTAARVSLTQEELETVASDLSDFMQSLNTDIEFSIHEKSGRMMVKVVDTKTHDVLKEFPPEDLLDTIGAIRDYVGALLDKKA